MARARRDIVVGLDAPEAGQRLLDFTNLTISGAGDGFVRDSLRLAIENELLDEQLGMFATADGSDIDVHAKGAAHVKG